MMMMMMMMIIGNKKDRLPEMFSNRPLPPLQMVVQMMVVLMIAVSCMMRQQRA